MHNGKRGGRCWGGGGGAGEEWWTETGKINMDVVSSRVLMSTTQGHVRKKYKWAERKNEERERCEILTVSATPPTVTAERQ